MTDTTTLPDVEAVELSYRDELRQLIDAAVQMALRHNLRENVVEAIAEGHRREEIDDDPLKCRFDYLYGSIWDLCNEADRNPWLEFAGSSADDPLWDEYQEEIGGGRIRPLETKTGHGGPKPATPLVGRKAKKAHDLAPLPRSEPCVCYQQNQPLSSKTSHQASKPATTKRYGGIGLRMTPVIGSGEHSGTTMRSAEGAALGG